MSKLTGPLLSIGATGQIGKTLVASKWRGVPYMRQYVTPQNPQTVAQTLTRDIFANLSAIWKQAGSLAIAPWERFATGQKFLGRNAFMGQNVKAMRGEADMQLFVGSPGAKGGLAPTSIALTPGAGTLDVDFTNPDAPTGWTLVSAVAAIFIDQAPEAAPAPTLIVDEDDVAQAQVSFAGLDAGDYVVSAWLEWTKADGSTAYGASINGTDTVT